MQINYEKKANEVISHLEQSGYCSETIGEHKRCYEGLQAHLTATHRPFTMRAALEWLESRKSDWSQKKYMNSRYALYRLDVYMSSGTITRRFRSGLYDFASHGGAAEHYSALLHEFRAALSAECGGRNFERHAADCTGFLAFLSEQGISHTSKMSIEQVFGYWHRVSNVQCPDDRKRRYASSAAKLLTFLAERGEIPHCYSKALLKASSKRFLPPHQLYDAGAAFQPSKELEPLAAELLSILDDQRYCTATKRKLSDDLTNYFLFIETNCIEHSAGSVESWLEHLPKNTLRERRRYNLAVFSDYLSTGGAARGSPYTWQPLQFDSLPNWSRVIISEFVSERQREGLARTTLKACRLASCRFFKFLDSKGVCNAHDITPELVREFHNTDRHSTPWGKNAYGTKVRQLLSYMAERKLVPQNLYLAISTQCAPNQGIVSIMSTEMESAIYRYREDAAAPLELRNAAIVMLGFRMGMRASDIVNLKISDINWNERTVSFVQIKTGKAITLPVPTDVGNSVYKYIAGGRPQSGAGGDGYVFIRHHAPFNGMKSIQACRYAFEKILSAHGLGSPPGQGFHITRRTFASRLLSSNNSIDDISNALGHTLTETVESYLSRDEEKMRLCPLPFESAGAE